MPCGCGGNSSGAVEPLLSTSLDSRFGSTPAPGSSPAAFDLQTLFSGPGGWIAVVLFVAAVVAVAYSGAESE